MTSFFSTKGYKLLRNPYYNKHTFKNAYEMQKNINNNYLKRSQIDYYLTIFKLKQNLKSKILKKQKFHFFKISNLKNFLSNFPNTLTFNLIFNVNKLRTKINRKIIFFYFILFFYLLFEFYKEEIKFLSDKTFKYFIVERICKDKSIQEMISKEIFNLTKNDDINKLLSNLVLDQLKRKDLKNDLKKIIHKAINDYLTSESTKKVNLNLSIFNIYII